MALILFLAAAPVFSRNVFSGLWRADNHGHSLWSTGDWTNFTSKWDELTATPGSTFRMHDFETYLEGNTRVHVGVYRTGTGGQAAWFTDDWNHFTSKWGGLRGSGAPHA